MQGTIDGFSHGPGTVVAALLVACLGAALGLLCAARSLRTSRPWTPGRLALGAAALGSGVWGMYLVAMTGFTVEGMPVGYDRFTTLACPVVGSVMAAAGIFVVGYRGSTPLALVTGGTVTGLALATTHYLGMDAVRLPGRLEYDTSTVALSVLIGVVGATTALWLVVSRRGLLPTLAAGAVMGGAATGMHYAGMAALRVRVGAPGAGGEATSPTGFLAALLVVPGLVLLVTAVVLLGERRRAASRGHGPCGRVGVPRQRTRPRRADRGPSGTTPWAPEGDRERTPARTPRAGSPDFHDW
ncbi:MHYT domain-containing protein [Streptomyces liangshanensis]|uniref:MHYT domain-containing protein n=1 Tax=Streptomyces liangshanensis TaxID=2717324 RepID=UPI0036D7637D